jgi:hypothetical protein
MGISLCGLGFEPLLLEVDSGSVPTTTGYSAHGQHDRESAMGLGWCGWRVGDQAAAQDPSST